MGNTTSNSKIEDLESLTLEASKPLNNVDANDCSASNNSWQTMKVDSSNLPSRLKLPKSKDLKSKEDSPLGQRKRSLQRTQSVPVPSIEDRKEDDSTSQPKSKYHLKLVLIQWNLDLRKILGVTKIFLRS